VTVTVSASPGPVDLLYAEYNPVESADFSVRALENSTSLIPDNSQDIKNPSRIRSRICNVKSGII
jgi:hypothetical protein